LFELKKVIRRSFILLIAQVLTNDLVLAQQDQSLYNPYPVQGYYALGISNSLYQGPTGFVSESRSSLCSQIDPHMIDLYESFENNTTSYEIEPTGPYYIESFDTWRCGYNRKITQTHLPPPHPPQVTESSTNSTPLITLCREYDSPPLTSEYPPQYSLPGGYDSDRGGCYCFAPAIFEQETQLCFEPIVKMIPPDKECRSGENSTNNPCNVATGNKFRSEPDITSGVFNFTRSYNSQVDTNLGLGVGWRGQYDKFLDLRFNQITVSTPSGRSETVRREGDQWISDSDSKLSLNQFTGLRVDETTYELEYEDGRIEIYDYRGFLIKEIDTKGNELNFTNGFNGAHYTFRQIRNQYRHMLQLNYENGLLTRLRGPDLSDYHYEYDDNKNLIVVIFPDLTPNDNTDNPRKIYHYENSDFPNHLTGITDENGDRYATFEYDENGKAVTSELGLTSSPVGQQKVELNYLTEEEQ